MLINELDKLYECYANDAENDNIQRSGYMSQPYNAYNNRSALHKRQHVYGAREE